MTDLLTLAALVAVGVYFVVANAGERNRTARIVTLVTGAILCGMAVIFGVLILLAAGVNTAFGRATGNAGSAVTIAVPVCASGLLGLLYVWTPAQRVIARVLPLRPGSPVGYAAVVLALLFLGFQLGTQLSTDVLSAIAAGPPLTNTDVLAQDIPLLLLGFVGVGVFVRRSPSETNQRLGLVLPRARWWLVALLGIGVFLLVGLGIETIAGVVTPGLQKRVTDVTNALFRRFDNPAAVIFLGVVAGVAEEVVFRGALQPRFGIFATALLFAAVHTQYGITFASLEVFVLGLGLGWLRARSGSTLPGIVTHAGYDIAVGLIGLIH